MDRLGAGPGRGRLVGAASTRADAALQHGGPPRARPGRRPVRGLHGAAGRALAHAAARRRRAPLAGRRLPPRAGGVHGQQRAPRPRGRPHARGADGAACRHDQALRGRHAGGRAAARRRRAGGALRGARDDDRGRRGAAGAGDDHRARGAGTGRPRGARGRLRRAAPAGPDPTGQGVRRPDDRLDGQPARTPRGRDAGADDPDLDRRGGGVGCVRGGGEPRRGPAGVALPGRAGLDVRADPEWAGVRGHAGCSGRHRRQGDRGLQRAGRRVCDPRALRPARPHRAWPHWCCATAASAACAWPGGRSRRRPTRRSPQRSAIRSGGRR